MTPEPSLAAEAPAAPAEGRRNDNAGHRARLRRRFLEAGIRALADHEKLELLLTFARPQIDTKPIARALLGRFKSIPAVLDADADALREVEGIGEHAAALIALVRELNLHCLADKASRGSVIASRREVGEYLRTRFGLRSEEYAAALFLDNSHHLIGEQIVAEGTINQCAVYPRTIVEKAVRLGAAAVILCHNHPGGTAQPSEDDWQITFRLHQIGRLMEIPLVDHVIVTRERVISMRELPRWPK